MSPKFPWKLFFVLLAAGLAGVIAALPMIFEMVEQFVPESEQQDLEANLPLPIPLLILAAFVQNSVFLGAAIAAGLALSRRIGTGSPLLAAKLNGEAAPQWRRVLTQAAIAGTMLGIVLVAVDVAIFLPRMPSAIRELAQAIPLWKRLLAGFLYGGITEELLMRLFLFSLVAWLLGKVWRGERGYPSAGAFWTTNCVIAVLFAVGHLPATQSLAPLTPAIVVRSLIMNGAASLTFGYLFWRRGLEAAMVAHACAHVGLQIVGPLFF